MINGGATQSRATLAGLAAILLWSTMVGLTRVVTEALGLAAGAALVYTACALLLLATTRGPRLSEVPRAYLWSGALLFTMFELSFTSAIGLAANSRQTIEVSIVNYLWPGLTVVFAVIFVGQRAGRLIIPGLLLSIVGVAVVLGGDTGLNLDSIAENIRSNPISYVLAVVGAFAWAGYSTVTRLYARGSNCVSFFFLCAAGCFWALYVIQGAPPIELDGRSLVAVAVAAGATGAGYYLWNHGITHGNMTFIAAMSYFTPVFSAAFSAVLLAASLTRSFWFGTAVVSVGALLCWIATRTRAADRNEVSAP